MNTPLSFTVTALITLMLIGCGKDEIRLEAAASVPTLYKCDPAQLEHVTKYVDMCYSKGMGTGYLHNFCVDTGIKNFCTLKESK